MSGDPQAPPSLPLFASDAFPSCDSRGVWFFERRKPMCALVVVVAALWLLGPLVGALLLVPSFAWWIRAQRVVWRAQVRASRTRAYRYALHSGGARAAQAAAAYAASHEHVAVVALQTFDPWLLLVGSVTVALHLDDADEPHGTSRLVQWLGAETATRMLDSASNGWRENIVYTPEGLRRSLFVRLVCSVHDCSDAQGTRAGRSLAERVRCVLEQCCALCVDDACRTVEALPSAEQVMAQGDVPSWPLFWSWLWGCPCCSQRQFAQLRTRPSNVRTSVLDVLRAALSEPTASRQLMRHASAWLDKWMPWSWVMMLDPRTWFELVPLSSFVYHRQAPFPMPAEEERFECAWGDTHLLLEGVEELLPHIAPERYVVTHHMTFAAHLGRDTHTRWEWEAHAWFEGHGFVLIRHPYTHATHAYQLDDEHMATLLRSMVPGAPADATDLDVTLVQWLVASHVWVLRDTEQDVAGDADLRHQRELREQGWTVVPQHQLVPLPYLNALRAYYKSRAVYLFDVIPGGKDRAWNDEPVARQLNCGLTKWAARMSPHTHLVQSALALSIFIRPGPGFLYHTDSSPPFDLTLDLVVDHSGAPRPLYFCRRRDGRVVVERLELRYGEAVLFRGAELTHWGGDLANDSAHTVALCTWQYVTD